MRMRSLALALALGLAVGTTSLAAQEATPAATAAATSADGPVTGRLLEFLRYVPDDASYRQFLTYGDKSAWLQSWNVPNVTSVANLDTLDKPARGRWMMIMPQQTTAPDALGLQYLISGDDLKTYGFDFFAADRYLEAGQPPNQITVVDGQFSAARIDAALKKLGYTTSPIETDGTLYSLRGDYETDLAADLPMIGKLATRNRIAVVGQRLIVGRATANIESALLAQSGTRSLADTADVQAAVAALNDPKLGEVGPLVGAILMDDVQSSADPVAMLGKRGTPQQIKQLQAELDELPELPPYTLSVFSTHHANGKTYLVLSLVFTAGADAEAAAESLSERIQRYASIMTQAPLLESIHAKFERTVALNANGVPVAALVLSADDPADDSTAVANWMRPILARDLGFLYVRSN